MFYYGAPDSAIGLQELRSILEMARHNWNENLDPIAEGVADRSLWKYGIGSHASLVRRILGSLLFNVHKSYDCLMKTCKLFINDVVQMHYWKHVCTCLNTVRSLLSGPHQSWLGRKLVSVD